MTAQSSIQTLTLTRGSWLGNLARSAARFLVRLYYSPIHVTGRECIPGGAPVLFAANHPNSLIDPVMIGIAAQRPVHFLAKAPLFDIPVFGAALRALGMIPAFRAVDDRAQLKRNVQSLAAGAAFLQARETIGIFPEGKSHDLPRVELIRSGAARMALQAVASGAADLELIPLGINYERKDRFRSAVWIRVGEPIAVSQFVREAEGDERRVLRLLTDAIHRRLKEVVVHLEEPAWAPLLDFLEVLVPPGRNVPGDRGLECLRQRKRIADAMNYFFRQDHTRAQTVAAELLAHHEQLRAARLSPAAAIVRHRSWRFWAGFARETFWLVAGSIPALAGTLHHLVPFVVVRSLAAIIKPPGLSTVSLWRLLLGLPIYGAWYALAGWWMFRYFVPWVAALWLVAMPFAGTFALNYWRRAVRDWNEWMQQLRMIFRRRRLRALREEHQRLAARIGALTAEYQGLHGLTAAPPVPRQWGRAAAIVVLGLGLALSAAWWQGRQRHARGLPVLPPANSPGRPVPAVREAELDRDIAQLKAVIDAIAALEARATVLEREFAGNQRSMYRQEDDDAIRQLLFGYLSRRTELIAILSRYYDPGPVADPRLRAGCFLAALTAGCELYHASFQFVTRFAGKPDVIRKLNEPEPRWNIPPRLYDSIRANLRNTRPIVAAKLQQYYERRDELAAAARFDAGTAAQFEEVIARAQEEVNRPWDDSFTREIWNDTRRWASQGLYDGQALASVWIGNTRIRNPRAGKPLVKPEQLRQFCERLRPGDILLERQNWYLSRAFMPGFWPHAALYLGTVADLEALGLADELRAAARASNQKVAAGTRWILEAVPQGGVRLTTTDHCLGPADYVAALRPLLDDQQVADALGRAFVHVGKGYDFDFDFFTTDKLVCTELVYRAYDAELSFPLVTVMGRKTLPPTEIVREFVADQRRPAPKLAFVAFLDANELTGRAEFVSQTNFTATIDRPGLTWLQPLSAAGAAEPGAGAGRGGR